MNNINRIILYFLICIPIRSYLIYLSLNLKNEKMNYLLTVLLVIGIAFIYKYTITDKNNLGNGAFNGKVWWNDLRLFHGINYVSFCILKYNGYNKSYYILIFDLIIGILCFINNYF